MCRINYIHNLSPCLWNYCSKDMILVLIHLVFVNVNASFCCDMIMHVQTLSNRLDDKNEKITCYIVDPVRWNVTDVPTPSSWFCSHFEPPSRGRFNLCNIYEFSTVVTRSHGLHPQLSLLSPFMVSETFLTLFN